MRYLIIGPPCSGKTTTLEDLRERGFNIVYESARDVLAEGKKQDPEFSFITQPVEAERRIVREQIAREKKADTPFFVETGVTNCLAYIEFYGLDDDSHDFVREIKTACKEMRYDKVFFLEAGQVFENDSERYEDNEEQAIKVGEKILEVHQRHGYEVIKIPFVPVKERTELILKHLKL